MGKKKIAAMVVAVVAVVASYNIYQSQTTNALSDLALTNVEALAQNESGVDDCIFDPSQNCIKLHPTDPSQDQGRTNYRW